MPCAAARSGPAATRERRRLGAARAVDGGVDAKAGAERGQLGEAGDQPARGLLGIEIGLDVGGVEACRRAW